ncbi:hypothetical protein Anapl_04048 [Anas platyrhynchos]|uniref:Uncharacterized protein n=1 Tax=Anas platyrhynchos TaxID=8839 RepID=R0K874_ANAPL|nr:hypothetical protein Anapl_04048 [Anas platyrhynchos]
MYSLVKLLKIDESWIGLCKKGERFYWENGTALNMNFLNQREEGSTPASRNVLSITHQLSCPRTEEEYSWSYADPLQWVLLVLAAEGEGRSDLEMENEEGYAELNFKARKKNSNAEFSSNSSALRYLAALSGFLNLIFLGAVIALFQQSSLHLLMPIFVCLKFQPLLPDLHNRKCELYFRDG